VPREGVNVWIKVCSIEPDRIAEDRKVAAISSREYLRDLRANGHHVGEPSQLIRKSASINERLPMARQTDDNDCSRPFLVLKQAEQSVDVSRTLNGPH
jgi:hypothetical protein